MKATAWKKELHIFAAVIALLASTGSLSAQTHARSNDKTVFVRVNDVGDRETYRIDSIPVEDPLRGLGERIEQVGQDTPVVVAFRWNASLRDVYNFRVLASKAGFRNIRCFISDPAAGFMSEIKFGRSLPFSTTPPPD